MYAEYGLGTPTRDTRRMMAEMLYGTRVEQRAATPADRPLSAMVADQAMRGAEVMTAETPDAATAPLGAPQGLGELVAEHAGVVLSGQEG